MNTLQQVTRVYLMKLMLVIMIVLAESFARIHLVYFPLMNVSQNTC